MRPNQLVKYLDHRTFPKALGELIRDRSGPGGEFENVRYTAIHPTQTAQVPAITYRLLRRTPGLGGVGTRKPAFRIQYKNEDHSITEVWSQYMTCLYQWDVHALTSDEADDYCDRLDRLIRANVGFFQSLRVQDVLFEEQLQDDLLPRSENIETRSIRYMVTMEQFEHRTVAAIEEIRVRVFLPQAEIVDTLVRGQTIDEWDLLSQTHVAQVVYVTDENTGSHTLTQDYIKDLDYQVLVDNRTEKAYLRWLEPGKRPDPGATYYVHYAHWTAFSTLYVPSNLL